MNYQLIALDLDGTLLNSRKEIQEETLRAIRKVAAAGKTLVFDTGRAVCELTDEFALLPEVRYAVFASGAGIYDNREKRAFALYGIPRDQAREIFALARTKDVMTQIVLPDLDIVQASQLDRLEYYNMGPYRPMYDKAMTIVPDIFAYAETCTDEILKINLYHADPPERIRTREQLAALDLEKVYSDVSSLEFSAKGIDKGTGLVSLCETLGVSPSECIAVGDGDNDLPMFRAAGLGVAMGNAAEHVKTAADRVVADLDHGGCAQEVMMLLDS